VARLQAKLDENAASEEAVAEIVEATPEVAAEVANAQVEKVELASEEVVAEVVALQETVNGNDLGEVAEAAVAEAVELVESNVTREDDAQDVSMEGAQQCTENISVKSVDAPNKKVPGNKATAKNLPESSTTTPAKTTTTWEAQFNKLQAYKAQHGNCKVPKIYPADPQLGRWVNTQRYKNNTNALNANKKAQLNSIDFEWTLREPNRSWKKWLKELSAYKDLYGHIDVPQRCKENKALGAFVSNIRSEYRKHNKGQNSMLNPKRIQTLEDLGFKWVGKKGAPANNTAQVKVVDALAKVEEVSWETRLNELADYRVRFGDCYVPKGWSENPDLGDWVEKLRQVS
jgi:hypothetical protein